MQITRYATKPHFYVALAWVYLHIVMLIGIVLVGVGIAHGLATTGAPRIEPFGALLLFAGLATMRLAEAVIETTLARAGDEPTHPMLSPGLKAAVAVVLLALALLEPPIPTAAAFVIAIAALAVPATYGAVVWYRSPAQVAQGNRSTTGADPRQPLDRPSRSRTWQPAFLGIDAALTVG